MVAERERRSHSSYKQMCYVRLKKSFFSERFGLNGLTKSRNLDVFFVFFGALQFERLVFFVRSMGGNIHIMYIFSRYWY